MPTIAIGIDLRRGTWLPAAENIVAVPHQPPAIDIDFIRAWYDRLDAEAASASALLQRQYWLDRTRARLRETVLASLVPLPAPRHAALSPSALDRLRAAHEPPDVLARLPARVRACRVLKRTRARLVADPQPTRDEAIELFSAKRSMLGTRLRARSLRGLSAPGPATAISCSTVWPQVSKAMPAQRDSSSKCSPTWATRCNDFVTSRNLLCSARSKSCRTRSGRGLPNSIVWSQKPPRTLSRSSGHRRNGVSEADVAERSRY